MKTELNWTELYNQDPKPTFLGVSWLHLCTAKWTLKREKKMKKQNYTSKLEKEQQFTQGYFGLDWIDSLQIATGTAKYAAKTMRAI